LEARSREYVDQRQRAGIVDYRAVRMFEHWGLADRVLGSAPRDGRLEIRIDGVVHVIGDDDFSAAIAGSLCPQRVLVRNLIEVLRADGGDVRFNVADVALRDLDTDRPAVSYRDEAGEIHEIACEFVAGCDGDHGICRESVPRDALARYSHDHGISWLTILTDTPPPHRPLMAVSPDGFAAQFARGPGASRFYLECAPGERVQDWSPERVWSRLRARLGDPALPTGPITDMELFALRSVVHDPMSYGRLYLLGDAAHILSPMGGKGMNLALYDAEVFAGAVRDFVQAGDEAGLKAYSSVCLERVWSCQEFSQWLLETTHDAGDAARAGEFRRGLARVRLRRLTESPTAARAFADLFAGLA
jgi:p-hydroxybenzoate 3-monooxygenase